VTQRIEVLPQRRERREVSVHASVADLLASSGRTRESASRQHACRRTLAGIASVLIGVAAFQRPPVDAHEFRRLSPARARQQKLKGDVLLWGLSIGSAA
jgi:hypothetical protein